MAGQLRALADLGSVFSTHTVAHKHPPGPGALMHSPGLGADFSWPPWKVSSSGFLPQDKSSSGKAVNWLG